MKPKVLGVSRMYDNKKAILVSFDRGLSDDELRRFHHWISVAAQKVSDGLAAEVCVSVALQPKDPGQ